MIPSDLSDFNLYGEIYRYLHLVYTPAASFSYVHGSTLKLVEYLKVFYICWMKTGYELLLPQGLTDYFEVIDVAEYATRIILHLDEKVLSKSEMGDSLSLQGVLPCG